MFGAMPTPLWDRLRQTRVVQVLVVYLGASWVVLQIADVIVDALSMPEWVMPAALLLLLIGLFITLATAWVQSLPSTTAAEEAGEVPDDWEIAPRQAFASLRAGKIPHLTWGRSVLGGVLMLSFLFGGTGLYVTLTGGQGVLGPQEAGASELADGIAIVPFEVRGGDLEVWREGMMDLLSNNLDGVAGYRTIDPRTVLARWSEEVGDLDARVDLDQALRVAGATGARYALAGSIVGTGDQVRLATSVYDLDSGEEVAQGRADGPLGDILSLADNLAVGTVRSLLESTGREGAGDLAPGSLTTESLGALRHFLDGERHFRRARFAEAVSSFEAALAEDSTFVLAMARLSDSYGWVEDVSSESGVDWNDRALAHVDELPPRHQLYLRASDALVKGSAELMPDLRNAVQRYPDDPDLWFLLVETIIHVPGGSMATPTEAARAADEAVALDPAFAPYMVHVAELAVMLDDREKAEATLKRYDEISGADDQSVAHVELALPLLLGDSAEYAQALVAARAATPRTLSLVRGTFETATDHFDRMEPVAAILGEMVGTNFDAPVLWSKGSRGAFAEAEVLAGGGVVLAVDRAVYLGHIADLWGATSTSEALRPLLNAETCADNHTCELFLTVALAQEGQWSDVDRLVKLLRTAATRIWNEEGDSVGFAYADVAEGRALLMRGDTIAARARLELWKTHAGTPGPLARHALGDLALAEGRINEASRLYAGLLMGFSRPAGLYGLARVAERRGDTDEARDRWRSFVTLTAGGDPERAPRIREGREALERLGG